MLLLTIFLCLRALCKPIYFYKQILLKKCLLGVVCVSGILYLYDNFV
jgi:hypothetical protein